MTKHLSALKATISKDLTWKAHINNITNKANKTLGFIKRNIHGCTQKVKQHTFTTMVRPTLEYASTPPYAINNRLQRAWLKSVSFQVGRLCRPGIIEDPRLYLGAPLSQLWL
jgi:hypothetical protein